MLDKRTIQNWKQKFFHAMSTEYCNYVNYTCEKEDTNNKDKLWRGMNCLQENLYY